MENGHVSLATGVPLLETPMNGAANVRFPPESGHSDSGVLMSAYDPKRTLRGRQELLVKNIILLWLFSHGGY